MRFLWRSLFGLFMAGIAIGMLAVAGLTIVSAVQERLARETPARPAAERVLAVNVLAVTPVDIAPRTTIFGEIRSTRSLDIRAPMGGTIAVLADAFVDGGAVEAGALLFAMDAADTEAARAQAEIDRAQAEAELRDALRLLELSRDELAAARDQAGLRAQALERQENLRARGVGSESAVEAAALALSAAEQAVLGKRQALAQAQSRIDLARTTLARREIALAEAERRLGETRVHAEFAGVLDSVTALRGGLVANNERLARLVDRDSLEVRFRVSNAQYTRLLDATGRLIPAEVEVRLDLFGIDVSAPARLVREGGIVGAGATGRQLFARLTDGQGTGLRPGDFVTVVITEPVLREVAVIPAAALSGTDSVLVLGPEDRLREVNVQVLRRQENDAIIRAPDLHDSRIVAQRTPLVGPGIRVRPVERDAGGAAIAPEPELIELSADRRARLIAFVDGNAFIPDAVRARIIAQLNEPKVPADVVERLESRMGG